MPSLLALALETYWPLLVSSLPNIGWCGVQMDQAKEPFEFSHRFIKAPHRLEKEPILMCICMSGPKLNGPQKFLFCTWPSVKPGSVEFWI